MCCKWRLKKGALICDAGLPTRYDANVNQLNRAPEGSRSDCSRLFFALHCIESILILLRFMPPFFGGCIIDLCSYIVFYLHEFMWVDMYALKRQHIITRIF